MRNLPTFPLAILLLTTGCYYNHSIRYDMNYEYHSSVVDFRQSEKYRLGIIEISGPIDWVTYREVVDQALELRANPGVTEMRIVLCSPGGTVDAAKGVIDFLNAVGKPYVIIINGYCGSACFELVRLAMYPVYATATSIFHVHGYRNVPDAVSEFDPNVTYAKAFDFPAGWLPLDQQTDHYFNAEDAVKYRVIRGVHTLEDMLFPDQKPAMP